MLRYGQPAPEFSLPSTEGRPLALSEFRGTGFDLLKKVAGFATTVEPIRVNGQPGIWLSGGGHVLIFRTGTGDVERKTVRVTGSVLDEERNVAYRSTFVIDREGVLRWGQAGDRQMIRDGREVLRVLNVVEGLRTPS